MAFQYPKGAYSKDGENIFSRACCDRTRSNGFKLREGRYKEEIFYHESGETLEQIVQRSTGGLIPGNIQGQVGWNSDQPGLVEDIPAHCRGLGYMTSKSSFQPKAFYDSVILFYVGWKCVCLSSSEQIMHRNTGLEKPPTNDTLLGGH